MADPKPLLRKDLARILPDQRVIRALEKLFELIPTDLDDVQVLAEEALLSANAVSLENSSLKQQVQYLNSELALRQSANLDPLLKRLDYLESLLGV